jgi:uroporphyrinogen-III synthase
MFLVTRPQPKAQSTCDALQASGFEAMALPAIKIKLLQTQVAAKAEQSFDVVIVTSSFTHAFLQENIVKLCAPHTVFLCVGESSAEVVNQCLATIDANNPISVAQPQNSEGIIASAVLKHIANKKVALLKGLDGRDLIAQYLEKNKAITNTYEVYERVSAFQQSQINEVESLPIKCIIVTSVEIAQHLIEHFSFEWLEQRIFMVASQRIYDYLISQGLKAPILSGSASSSCIVTCAKQLHLSGVLDDRR